jgi:ABC-2 type transport system permease protein
MTSTTVMTTAPVGRDQRSGMSDRVHDIVVLVRRNLIHIRREPLQLSDATVQPVLFTLLFIYVFGSGVPIHGGTYKDFAIPGLMLLNLTTAAMGTAVGLVSDITTGAIDRFSTLPMWRSAVLVGRSLADLLQAALCVSIVALTGLAIGWRPDANAGSILAGFGIALLFTYSLSWACASLGIVSKGPESAQGIGLIILFPLAIVSNAMVPTAGMPGWLQTIANWNPVSAVTAAVRTLFGSPNPSAQLQAWPMQHPILASLAWSAVLIAIFAPLSAHLFKKKTVG